jgi:glycogen operon protein
VEGAYVGLPLEDLLGVLALESVRAGAMIVGEDLGTVPDGLRERLWDKGLYSYRVLPFERRGDDYPPPGAWPVRAMACVTTHDLPPLAGWWAGADIDERAALGLIDAAGAKAARAERAADRAAIARALVDEALVVTAPAGEAPVSEALAAAIHRLVARSACALALAQVEDLAGEREAVNLPGTDTERPNWRRRLASPIETLMDRPGAQAILAALRAERPGRKPP